jgi:hypothetical protein
MVDRDANDPQGVHDFRQRDRVPGDAQERVGRRPTSRRYDDGGVESGSQIAKVTQREVGEQSGEPSRLPSCDIGFSRLVLSERPVERVGLRDERDRHDGKQCAVECKRNGATRRARRPTDMDRDGADRAAPELAVRRRRPAGSLDASSEPAERSGPDERHPCSQHRLTGRAGEGTAVMGRTIQTRRDSPRCDSPRRDSIVDQPLWTLAHPTGPDTRAPTSVGVPQPGRTPGDHGGVPNASDARRRVEHEATKLPHRNA